MLPVTRLAAAMGNGDDKYEVRLDSVKDAVRENPCEAAPNIFVERPPAQRVFKNDLDCVLDTNDEAQLQTGLLLSIVVGGLVVFFERLRMELMPHRPSERRTRASASSPGIA